MNGWVVWWITMDGDGCWCLLAAAADADESYWPLRDGCRPADWEAGDSRQPGETCSPEPSYWLDGLLHSCWTLRSCLSPWSWGSLSPGSWNNPTGHHLPLVSAGIVACCSSCWTLLSWRPSRPRNWCSREAASPAVNGICFLRCAGRSCCSTGDEILAKLMDVRGRRTAAIQTVSDDCGRLRWAGKTDPCFPVFSIEVLKKK